MSLHKEVEQRDVGGIRETENDGPKTHAHRLAGEALTALPNDDHVRDRAGQTRVERPVD